MEKLIQKHIKLIKYFFIGISASLVDVLVYLFLFNVMDWSPLISTAISISLATVYGFTLNLLYNFKTKNNIALRLLSYSLTSGAGLLVSIGMLQLFTNVHGYDGNLIKILSLPIVFLVQYLLNTRITFATKAK